MNTFKTLNRRTFLGAGTATLAGTPTLMRTALAVPALSALSALGGCSTVGAPSGVSALPGDKAIDRDTTAALHRLFDEHWEASARLSPEAATYRGDHRYGDRLSEVGPEADAKRDGLTASSLARARTIRAEGLSPSDRVSLDMFVYNLQTQQRLSAFEGLRTMSLGGFRSLHNSMAGLMQAQPVDTTEQRQALLSRLAAFPRRAQQETAQLEQGKALGWVSSRAVVERALNEMDAQLKSDLRKGPFFEPWRRLPKGMEPSQALQYQAEGEALLRMNVLAPLEAYRRFVASVILPAAPASGSLSGYPQGQAAYAELVRLHTTTARTPDEIHATGLRELDRLHQEFRQLMGVLGLQGSFADAVKQLSQPGNFFPDREAMLEGYRAVSKQIDPLMPRLFVELPRAPYGIRPMADHLGPGAADNYTAPPADGSGPGWYNANVLAFSRRPRWALPSLVAHETVPGHHLQIARARELQGLPQFRRQGGYTVFSEGWALYAERLMDELGFYARPEDRWGFLQAQAFRAARLVVDTGLHAKGWSRQQAIDFMIDRVGESPVFMTAEVDRYLANPGQALAYMTGQLHILGLRDKARQALGERFDLRRFNNAVIDQGSLPLDVLSKEIDDWIGRQAA